MVCIALTNRTASSRQLPAHCLTETGVSFTVSWIHWQILYCGLHAITPLYKNPRTQNHRRQWLQCAHEYWYWHSDRQKVIYFDESCFNLGYYAGCIRVEYYAGKRYLLECLNEHHSRWTPQVKVWFAIGQYGRSQMLINSGQTEQVIQ